MNMFVFMVFFGAFGFLLSKRRNEELADHLQYVAVFALIGLVIGFLVGVVLLNAR